jgi:diguanylate cyclase (GGDEF)-like protein
MDPLISARPGPEERLLMRLAATLLASDLSLNDLFDRLAKMLVEYVDASMVFVALARPDNAHTIEYLYDHGEIRSQPNIPLGPRSRARAVIASGETIWGNRPDVWAPDGTEPVDRDRPWTNDSVCAIFVPLRAAGGTIGCLSVQSNNPDAYTEDDAETIGAIGHYLGVAVQNQRMLAALQRSAEYDSLTTLASHSRMSRELDRAVAEATSTRPAAAIMLNLVNFGMFNETYGHAEGDSVLRVLAQALRGLEDAGENVRVGRFGGDVFMALLTDTSTEIVPHFVERLMARLADLSYVARDQTLPISLACGYAIAPSDAGTRADLTALCVHRTRLSRKQGCRPVGNDDVDAYAVHGTFAGIDTIVEALLDRDPFTRVHLLQCNAMAKHWSEFNLDLDHVQLAKLLQASLLHDVGKLLVSDRILVKPGRLTESEYESAMQHASFGRDILANAIGYEDIADIVGQHHERWDGGGYPVGLVGDEIHPIARAVSILDAFSAMVADRPYHRGIAEAAALAELRRCAGTQFDPDLTERFVQWREEGSPCPLV